MALRGARAAIAARDLDTAWAAMDTAARAHHGATGRAARPGASAGGTAEWVTPPARAREQVREEPQELRRARRRAGLLRAALREAVQSERGAAAASVARFLAIACHAEEVGSVWRPHLVVEPCVAGLLGLVAEDQWATGGRRLYAWLRSPPQVPPPPVRAGTAPPGTLPALRLQEQAWHAIWARPTGAAALGQWGAALDELPPMPPPPDLSGADLAEAASRMRVGRAPGAGGWHLAHIRAWTLAMFDVLASVLALVEATGRWLRAIDRSLVCLLPKGGTAEPLDRRPI